MTDRIIITAGSAYVDIDVLASSFAYKELLESQGRKVSICHTGPLNSTIPTALGEKVMSFIEKNPPESLEQASFVLVDVSDPNHFEKFVNHERIEKIFDHHFGFEDYWNQRLGENSIIKSIGACATLIWQEYEKHDKRDISLLSAELLATAILSNTLNLKASVTMEADRNALSILESRAQLTKDWREKYYLSTKEQLLKFPQETLFSDTKHVYFEDQLVHFCQMETWDGQSVMNQICFKDLCMELFPKQSWLLNLIDISSGKSRILTNNSSLALFLQQTLELENSHGWLQSKKLWLRKEILKIWQEKKHLN